MMPCGIENKVEEPEMEPLYIPTDKLKPMHPVRLFFWRFKRLFKSYTTIQIEYKDCQEMLESMAEFDMSPSEYVSYILEDYIKNVKCIQKIKR